MKVDCRDIDAQAPLTEPREPVGVPRQMPDLAGIGRMDNLNGSYVLAIQHDEPRRPPSSEPEDRVALTVGGAGRLAWGDREGHTCIRLIG